MILALAAPRSWQYQQSSRPATSALPDNSKALEPLALDSVASEDSAEPNSTPQLIAPAQTRAPATPPVRQEFDLATLMQVRNQVLTLLDQLSAVPSGPASDLSASKPAAHSPAVRVTSENDRLAMLPTRSRRSRTPTSDVESAKTIEKEANEFAALLLEAARYPQQAPSFVNPTTRIALAPSRSRSVPSTPEIEPTPTIESTPPESTTSAESNSEPQTTPALQIPAAPAELAPPTILQAPALSPPAEPVTVVTPPVVTPPALRHRPQALIAQLQEFAPGSAGAMWSQQVLGAVRQLSEASTAPERDASLVLKRLEQLELLGLEESTVAATSEANSQWRRAALALGRRLVLWRLLLDPNQPKLVQPSPATVALLPLLDEVSTRLADTENGDDWREYLLLDQIPALTSEGLEAPTLARAKLAQAILARMTDEKVSAAQADFLSGREFVQLRAALRPWAAGKVNLETLAALVERYESGREVRYAEVIAQLQQRLRWSDDLKLQMLSRHLDQHYRGANMRIAMSDLLMNRMLPAQKPIVSPVRERIAGAKVRGRARTTTQLRVRLKPDPAAWHVSLEATGKVYSDTRSDTWPARIRNAARMQYEASKDVEVSERGMQTSPSQAIARGRNELVGVDSEFDPIPIVGHLLRDMARKKHSKNRSTANSQAKAKVVRQVKERMDTGLEEKLDEFEQKFRNKVLAPIEELALLAEPLDMHTTQDRAVMQLRLANSGQLAAHTLRPYAPSDSVLSVQMHETALNNAMMGLGLDGKRMTMLELFEFITDRVGATDASPPADMPQRAIIHFAKRDAVRVQCEGDRLELVLSVAELSHRRDRIKNFEIHVHFRPVLSGLSVKLVRDGTLQFSGRRLKTGPRVVLHSILGKVLNEDREYTLVSPKLMLDPRFQGLMVTQLVLEDGWIGLAIGPAHPRRTAWRAPLPEVLSTPFVR
ncbi:MAG: hypothetical protein AAGD11_06425 [Planctomycetota bacterium]